jgi:hypothetical protein
MTKILLSPPKVFYKVKITTLELNALTRSLGLLQSSFGLYNRVEGRGATGEREIRTVATAAVWGDASRKPRGESRLNAMQWLVFIFFLSPGEIRSMHPNSCCVLRILNK